MAAGLVMLLLVSRLVNAMPVAAQTGGDLPGMIGDGTYESPQFGTSVTWTDAWELGNVDEPHVAHAIGGYATEPVVSDRSLGDVVYLSDTASGTAVITLSLTASGMTLDTIVSRMDSDSFLEDNLFMEPGADVLSLEKTADSVGLLVRDTGENSAHALYFAVTVPDNPDEPIVAVAVDLFDPSTYEASLRAADKDLTIEGFDLFAAHSVSDVLGLLDAQDADTTATDTSSGPADLSDDEYLDAVREDTDLRRDQLDRLQAILFDGGTITAADNRELEEILNDWVDMKPIPAPDGFATIDDEHRALVKNLNALGSALLAIAAGGLDDEEQQQQVNLAGGALQTALALVDELDDSLKDEGA
ncbi:MAG: hypothetical protein QM589_03990 [Thermomicrobiales bacterium]